MLIHMRTNIVLDDALVEEAAKVTGIKTKRDLVHEGLRALIKLRKHKKLSVLRGKIRFASGYDHKKLRSDGR
jgi:Arc/MetJ family transcription regulator